jgi:hypothetical protein
MLQGIVQRSQQAGVLGVIVRLAAQKFAKFGDRPSEFIFNDDSVSRRAGIAARAAVDVGHQISLIETGDGRADELLRAIA